MYNKAYLSFFLFFVSLNSNASCFTYNGQPVYELVDNQTRHAGYAKYHHGIPYIF